MNGKWSLTKPCFDSPCCKRVNCDSFFPERFCYPIQGWVISTFDAACEKILPHHVPALCVMSPTADLVAEYAHTPVAFMKLHISKAFLKHRCTRSYSEWARRLGGVTVVALPCLPAREHAPASVGMRQWVCHAHVSIVKARAARIS